ncbi:hypothetical protein GCK72_012804 [Caenorhabditis remanei]|uniref:Uncharacterized protein n=1 Tax=Caenorhabditis remanei TaxID=31234 RepID=A0A6A5GNU4_CAERE|nr:hypothetical protein GCK72_012804 [Caenorhabditis remanei]KAF1756351.1 hypothetical protein GCK72_012804 [Caenorhabditis remanei]
MSVEGLLSEVQRFNAHTLDVALGEQLFFGGKRVFSDVKPGTSSGGEHHGAKACGKNELKGAVDHAKRTCDKALGGQKGGEGSADVAKILKEQTALVKKVDELASLVAKLQLELASLREGQVITNRHVLILGDGNLSFSLAIASSDPETIYFATVFDSREEFIRKYRAEDTLRDLEALRNVVLVFGVDATDLPAHWKDKFDTIIMNFPHPGGKTNLKKSKILLSGIFKSLQKIMDNDSQFLLSLAIGQSGIEKVENPLMKELPKHKKDSWQAIYFGAEQGFIIDSVEIFDTERFRSYKSSGYKDTMKGFNNREGLTLAFKKCDNQGKKLEEFRRDEVKAQEGVFHYYRPYYSQDLSFLYKINETEGEVLALKLLKALAGNCLAEVTEIKSLRSICPDPELPNRIYRIVWQGVKFPMGRIMCGRIHEELRYQIAQKIVEDNLPLTTAAPVAKAAAPAKEETAGDDDFDLFGSEDEEEDEAKKKIVEERLAAYAEKKSKKAGPIAKSSVILDVKPWDDETDLAEMEKLVRSIEMDGLVWGGGKLLPIGYGIKKLQIITVIEDLKVSVDDLIEKIQGDFEDHVQSVDIVAFNKI